MRERKVDSHAVGNDTTVCPGELKKLFEHPLGVANVGAIADRRLTIYERLGERIGDRLRRRRKAEQNLQRISRDNLNPRRSERFDAFSRPWRSEKHPLLRSRNDDPSAGLPTIAITRVGADEYETFLDCDQGSIGF